MSFEVAPQSRAWDCLLRPTQTALPMCKGMILGPVDHLGQHFTSIVMLLKPLERAQIQVIDSSQTQLNREIADVSMLKSLTAYKVKTLLVFPNMRGTTI